MKVPSKKNNTCNFSSVSEFQRHYYPDSIRPVLEDDEQVQPHEGTGLASSFLKGVRDELARSSKHRP